MCRWSPSPVSMLPWKEDQLEDRRSANARLEHHAVHLDRQLWPVPPQIRSRIVLVGLLLLFVASLLVPLRSAQPSSSSTPGSSARGDAAMFGRVVARIEGGEAYYPAMGHELRVSNYPAASVFNWRTPALYLALAAAPRWTVVSLVIALYVILLASYMVYFAQNVPPEGTVIGLVLSAAAAATVLDSRGRLLTEAWCGILIGLSLAAYMWRAWTPGAITGLAAMFVRELAAPYCIVCILLAARARRKRELAVWAVGLMIFGGSTPRTYSRC